MPPTSWVKWRRRSTWPKLKVSDAKMEPKRYPKQSNNQVGTKRGPNEPRNLQIHPCGTGSQKVSNKAAKRRKRVIPKTRQSDFYGLDPPPLRKRIDKKGDLVTPEWAPWLGPVRAGCAVGTEACKGGNRKTLTADVPGWGPRIYIYICIYIYIYIT